MRVIELITELETYYPEMEVVFKLPNGDIALIDGSNVGTHCEENVVYLFEE